MNYKLAVRFLDYMSNILRVDAAYCFDIFKLINPNSLTSKKQSQNIYNEFSFIGDENGVIESKIRILNLFFPKNISDKKLKELKKERLKNISDIFSLLSTFREYACFKDLNKIKRLMRDFNANPDWLLQFGFEIDKNNNLRIKVYFSNNNRVKNDPFFIIKNLEKISEMFGIKYNRLVDSLVFNNKIDAIAIDFTKKGIGIKIYDYTHYPDEQRVDYLLAKYELFGDFKNDSLYKNFATLIKKHKLYGERNFDTMFAYRFALNSMELKSEKIYVHIKPYVDAGKFFNQANPAFAKDIYNQKLFDFMRINNIKLSFIGHEKNKIFFYVR